VEHASYAYVQTGRRPIVVFALVISAGLLVFSMSQGAPWWFYPPVVFAVAASAWMVLANPSSGIQLTDREIRVFSGSWDHSFALGQVASMAIIDWVDGGPSAIVRLRDGSEVFVPSACLPSATTLVEVLGAHGIRVDKE
jgi:hypothetical protein